MTENQSDDLLSKGTMFQRFRCLRVWEACLIDLDSGKRPLSVVQPFDLLLEDPVPVPDPEAIKYVSE